MADIVIEITVPDAKVAKATTGFLEIYPNDETIDDPAWVDPEDGSEADQIAKYTTKQWVEEQLRRMLVRDVHRGNQMIANAAVKAEVDDGVATI